MSVQLTYEDTPAVAYLGMIAEQFSQRQIDTGIVEGTRILIGQAVKRGTNPGQVANIDSAFETIGVAVTTNEVTDVESFSQGYAVKEAIPYMQRGRIWVKSSGAVIVGAEVAPNLNQPTRWGEGANTGTGVRAFARTAAGGADELMMIELTGPQGEPDIP